MPRLQVLNGKRQGAVYDVAQGAEHVIGHRQSASITIDDPWVSWDHARIFFNDDDLSCWIEDLGSTNGTYVNCVRVKREPLRHEDIVFLGKTHVIFLSPAEEHQPGDPFGAHDPALAALPSSGSAPGIPLSSASKPGILGAGSSADPFRDSDQLAALRDPFQSAPSQAGAGVFPSSRKTDPFADSGVDPFAAGPDYTSGSEFAARKLPPAPSAPVDAPAASGSFRAMFDPAREARALSETNSDENALFAPQGDLRLSELDDDHELTGPSAQEISRLITGRRDSGRTAAPKPPETLGGPVETPLAEASTRRRPPHEASTRPPPPPAASGRQRPAPPPAASGKQRPVPPAAASGRQRPVPPAASGRQRPVPPPAASGGHRPAPILPATVPPPPATPSGQIHSGPASRPGTTPGAGGSVDLAALAFERARLEDTARRLKAALDAASLRDPAAVKAATEGLRSQELARQARRIADLEQRVVTLQLELVAKQDELDGVTDDMIEKEDMIERLSAEVARARALTPSPMQMRSADHRPHGLSSHDNESTFDNLSF